MMFEIEAGHILKIHAARDLSKEFVSVCNCIIIVSELNTVVEFGIVCCREAYILSDDLNKNEVKNSMSDMG